VIVFVYLPRQVLAVLIKITAMEMIPAAAQVVLLPAMAVLLVPRARNATRTAIAPPIMFATELLVPARLAPRPFAKPKV